MTDRRKLVRQQYGDGTNLNARAALHARFGVNGYGWFRWLYDHIAPRSGARVLDLGCGTGALWAENRARLPLALHLTLADLSPGMLDEARAALVDCACDLAFDVVDAVDLPYADASFDIVVANHMLYHVADLSRAIGEIRRVLAPGGRLCASTIGDGHMREVIALAGRFAPEADPWSGQFPARFTLESGEEALRQHFRVTLHRYADALEVTEAEPLLAYLLSTGAGDALRPRRDEILAHLHDELLNAGVIRITKDSGLFIGEAE